MSEFERIDSMSEDTEGMPQINPICSEFPYSPESLNAAFSQARAKVKNHLNENQVVYWNIESYCYDFTSESVWNFKVYAGYPRSMFYALVTY